MLVRVLLVCLLIVATAGKRMEVLHTFHGFSCFVIERYCLLTELHHRATKEENLTAFLLVQSLISHRILPQNNHTSSRSGNTRGNARGNARLQRKFL